jgi:predicted ATPase
LIALADAQRLPSEASALANGFIGWVETETGDVAEGLARMGKSIGGWQEFWGAWCFPLDAAYALAVARTGDTATALQIVDAASEIGGDTGGHWWDAEFHRVRGNIQLLDGTSSINAALVSFQNAIHAAKERKAQLFEMRAATDLARLYSHGGDSKRALETVGPIVRTITEGQDLPDFLAAKAVLESSSKMQN